MTTEPQIGPPQGAASLPLTAQAVAVEPVTDEDARVATQTYFINMKQILAEDRRRVAERQAGRQGDYNPASLSHEAANAELAHISGTISDAREIERLRAEVARLSAACAAKDEALRLLTDMDELRETDELYIARAALSDTAGKGWVDASGAVRGVCEQWGDSATTVMVPDEWADDEVLIVRKPK